MAYGRQPESELKKKMPPSNLNEYHKLEAQMEKAVAANLEEPLSVQAQEPGLQGDTDMHGFETRKAVKWSGD